MRGILEALAAELKIHGLIDVEEAFIDGVSHHRKKGLQDRENKAR
jgi:predicted aconitase